jgi:hypothetical protein
MSFATSCLLWLALRLTTERLAYMVHPGAGGVPVSGHQLRPGSGPFWGRRRFTRPSMIELETPFGVDDVSAVSLIELESRLSGPDHLR